MIMNLTFPSVILIALSSTTSPTLYLGISLSDVYCQFMISKNPAFLRMIPLSLKVSMGGPT